MGTISVFHETLPIVGTGFHGSVDHVFQWEILPEHSYEGFPLASPGIRNTSDQHQLTGTVYTPGILDCTLVGHINSGFKQRPALMM